MFCDGIFYQSKKYDNLEVDDRVGDVDGFSSGMIYGFLKGLPPQECIDMGTAYGAFLQNTRGDTSIVTMGEIKYLMNGSSARI
jgi:2-dehydro-3-deoxygluconokinase